MQKNKSKILFHAFLFLMATPIFMHAMNDVQVNRRKMEETCYIAEEFKTKIAAFLIGVAEKNYQGNFWDGKEYAALQQAQYKAQEKCLKYKHRLEKAEQRLAEIIRINRGARGTSNYNDSGE